MNEFKAGSPIRKGETFSLTLESTPDDQFLMLVSQCDLDLEAEVLKQLEMHREEHEYKGEGYARFCGTWVFYDLFQRLIAEGKVSYFPHRNHHFRTSISKFDEKDVKAFIRGRWTREDGRSIDPETGEVL